MEAPINLFDLAQNEVVSILQGHCLREVANNMDPSFKESSIEGIFSITIFFVG